MPIDKTKVMTPERWRALGRTIAKVAKYTFAILAPTCLILAIIFIILVSWAFDILWFILCGCLAAMFFKR